MRDGHARNPRRTQSVRDDCDLPKTRCEEACLNKEKKMWEKGVKWQGKGESVTTLQTDGRQTTR